MQQEQTQPSEAELEAIRTLGQHLSPRAAFTLQVAKRIRKTGYRFDKSWRHADIDSNDPMEMAKAAFYEKCCTFAANDIADDPASATGWIKYL